MPAVTPANVPGAQRDEHIAEMADRRVGQDAFQVGLRDGDDAAQQGGDAAHRWPRCTGASGDAANSGVQRATIYTPAVTIVAAWIRALTGVGPSMASGSQTCSGNWALLPQAPQQQQQANRRRPPVGDKMLSASGRQIGCAGSRTPRRGP